MAGIEPASGGVSPRIFYERSRPFILAQRPHDRPRGHAEPAAGARKRLFRTVSGIPCGTPAFSRPTPPPAGERGGRTPPHSEAVTPAAAAYAATGMAATFVRLALIFCADFTSSAPLGSQSGTSPPPSKPFIPEFAPSL